VVAKLRAVRVPAVTTVVAIAAALVVCGGVTADPPVPLIGVTYTHTSVANCDLNGHGIVQHYDRPGMRRLVRTQLAAMHAAGIQTIRILLSNMSDITGQDWGVIPSANGLVEPYRSNLIRFVSDVRAAGFQQLTVHFSPQWTNEPIGTYGPSGLVADNWDPAKFDENWNFISQVHQVVTQYGPPSTHFDMLSEGPPTMYQPAYIVDRLENYITDMYSRYVDAFGSHDVTVTTIGDLGQSDRLRYNVLVLFDRILDDYGLTTQPLVVGESSYENPAAAADIARFETDTGRPVSEVYEWWSTTHGGRCFSAPYRADAYISALTSRPVPPATPDPLPLLPVPTLHALVRANGTTSLTDASGAVLSALDAGQYTIDVADRSRRAGFMLAGPGFARNSGRRFTGRRVWHVDIGSDDPYGSVFSYGADHGRLHPLVVH
jgi:hypothetical protein